MPATAHGITGDNRIDMPNYEGVYMIFASGHTPSGPVRMVVVWGLLVTQYQHRQLEWFSIDAS